MTLAEIEEEVLPKLTLEEKHKLAGLLAADEALAADNALWDAQLREDCKPGGIMHQLGKEAFEEFKRGETEEWV